MKIRTKIIARHTKGCDAVAMVKKGAWRSSMFLTDRVVCRDSIGRENGSGTRWLVAECNCGCPARTIINAQDLLAAVAP